jgi:glucose-6-phosphate isomerase
MTLRLDYAHMLARHVQGGLDDVVWRAAGDHLSRAMEAAARLEREGKVGFVEIVSGAPDLTELRKFADGVGQAFSDVVVLGIGGSALGAIALRSALRSPRWNELDDEKREFYPRLHVLENVDPSSVLELLGRIELGRTLFIVISKSGGTPETMAQYLIVRDRLARAMGEGFHRHLVFITDPEKGALRRIAREERIVSLGVPSNVGGRFSVLSPVGLLPAALVGIDVVELLAGAADMLRRGRNASIESNPPGAFAVLQWLADTSLGLHNHVLMPYSDPLRDLSAWFVQLWAESLGKTRSDGVAVGPTPIAALGATDQHSQVQLFMEGPRDKTVTFIGVRERAGDLEIPSIHPDIAELAYLGGHSLGALLDVERRATAGALARAGRPNMTLEVERLDAWHLGGMLMFFELATLYAGMLYGIDPLVQPGVELGKRFTFAMLERPDADEARREWASVPKAEPRWVE